MAESSLVTQPQPVKTDISLEEWTICASKDFNFRPEDVSQSKELLKKTEIKPLSDEEKKILQTLKDSKQLEKVGKVTELCDNRYLAWGTTPPDVINFYLLDPSSANPVLLEFPYNVTSFIEAYTEAYMGSCSPDPRSTVDFGFWTNQSRDLVVVMGPAEEEKFTESGDFARRNGCKLVKVKTAKMEEFSVALPSPFNVEGPAYPAAFSPDPRPGHQDEVVIIGSASCAGLEFDGTENILGYPARYSFADGTLKTINTDKLLFGKLLHFINGGERVACLEHPEFDHDSKQKPQKIWILNTDTLLPLYTILHSGLDAHIVLLVSSDNKHIAEVSAGYRLGNHENKVSIFKVPEPHSVGEGGSGFVPMNTMTMFQVEISKEY